MLREPTVNRSCYPAPLFFQGAKWVEEEGGGRLGQIPIGERLLIPESPQGTGLANLFERFFPGILAVYPAVSQGAFERVNPESVAYVIEVLVYLYLQVAHWLTTRALCFSGIHIRSVLWRKRHNMAGYFVAVLRVICFPIQHSNCYLSAPRSDPSTGPSGS